MKLGVNPWTVYGWDLPEMVSSNLIEQLAKMECEGIELIIDEGHNSPDLLLAHQKELCAQAKYFGMEIPSVASALFWRYNLASQNEDLRTRGLEVIHSGCKVTQAYGGQVFLAVAGLQEPGVEYARSYDTAVQSLRQAGAYAADAGVVVGVENVPSNFLCSPGEYARFIQDVDHPSVQAYVDFGNGASIGSGYPENWITALRGHIAMVHAKDYDQGFKAFVCCGQGDLDWDCVFSAFTTVNYSDYLIVETPPKGGRGKPTFASGLQAAQTSLSWLSQFTRK